MENILQKNIKKQLKKQNLSIAELERRTGLRHAVINIIHGRSKNPGVHSTYAIAKGLGCSIEELLAEENLNIASKNAALDNATLIALTAIEPLWDPILGKEVMDAINEFLITHQLKVDINDVFKCIIEVYNYALENSNKQVDYQFANWMAERIFIKTKKQV